VIKKGTVLFIVVLFLALAALGYYIQQRKRAVIGNPYSTIPQDAGAVMEVINLPDFFESLASDNEIIEELSLIEGMEKFTRSVYVIDSLSHRRDLRGFLNNNRVLISFHLIGRDRVVAFFSAALPPEIRERHMRESLSGLEGYTYGVKEYQGSRIYELQKDNDASMVLYLSYIKGMLICSRSGILVESGIRQSEEPEDIRALPGFSRVASAAGKNENKIFLVFSNLPRIIGLLTGDPDRGIAARIGMLASCSETDIYLKKDGLMMSGYIETTDSSQILYKYLSHEPANFESYLVIPSNVAMFESLIGHYPATSGRRTGGESLTYLADIIRPQLNGEATKVCLDIQGQTIEENSIMLLRLKGRSATEKVFADEITTAFSATGKPSSEYIINWRPDDQSDYTIYLLPGEDLSGLLYHEFGSGFSSSYATFYDNWLVLAKRPETLSKFIYDNILSRTLANDLSYRDFEGTMPSRAGYYYYSVPSRIISVLSGRFKESIVNGLVENINSLNKVGAVGYQFMSSNGMIYNTLSVSFRGETVKEASTQWESLLDTMISSKPMFFTNHYTGRNEIFIQDLNNNVYLINSAGRILWKLSLEEKIKGDPYMIDYYRNGKNQILFATENYLHLLDRNGNYVERFPVRLRARASNGLSMFDYEDNQNYRLFIAGSDRIIYAYDKSGSVVRGWEQFKTNGIVTSEIEFFRVSGKDYLVVNDEENIYILDRRGNTRVDVKEPVARAAGSSLRLTSGSSPRILLSSRQGTLKFISFNGDVETKSIDEFSDHHIFEYFDLDGDGSGDYIYIDNGKIIAYNSDLSRMFSESLNTNRIFGPYGLVFSSADRKIGLVEANNGLIHMFDSKGKNARGFPLRGSAPFSVGKFSGGNSFNLITGGSDSFLYNYEITR